MKEHNCACTYCGERFYKRPDQITKNNFCSRKCFGGYLSEHNRGVPRPEVSGEKPHLQKRVTIKCVTCGTSFSVKMSHANKRKFCSTKCHFEHRRDHPEEYPNTIPPHKPRSQPIPKNCEQCGAMFAPKNKKIRFCSSKCVNIYRTTLRGEKNKQWRGGPVDYYGPNWVDQKRKARVRDKVCQKCGYKPKRHERRLDVHHIVPFRVFGVEGYLEANHLDNLICYCRPCHAKTESHVHDKKTGQFADFSP